MKYSVLILLLITLQNAIGQDCDNILFTNDSVVKLNTGAYIVDCDAIYYDTTYDFIPFLGSPYATCYKLYHHNEDWLIRERWTKSDTTFTKEYYRSGKLKSESYFYDYLNNASFHYYENGQLEYGGVKRIDTLVERKSFYENGNIRHIDYSFAGSVYDSVIHYYPNGLKSSIAYYTPFTKDLLGDLNYKETKILAEHFLDENGDTIDYNKNEMNNVNVFHYPMMDTTFYRHNPDITTFYHIKDQKGYDSNMTLLKERINKKIKFPKSFDCPIAYCYLKMRIDKNGSITIHEVSNSKSEISDAVETAVNKIGKWEVGMVNGKPMEVVIITDLIIKNN